MNYYKASIVIKDGHKIYGNLPKDFVIGYEDMDTMTAYFELQNDVVVDEDAEIQKMTKNHYEYTVNELIKAEAQKRSLEQQHMVEQMLTEEQKRRDMLKQLADSQKSADQKYRELDLESASIEQVKAAKIGQLKEACESAIEYGFVSSINEHHYRTNRDDQVNFIGQKDELMGDESILEVIWKTEDVGYIKHTREDWLAIHLEGLAHKKAQLFKYDQLKKQVMILEEKEEVVEVEWDIKEEPAEEPVKTEEVVEEEVTEAPVEETDPA